MKILWVVLAILGGITGIWYFKSISSPRGRMDYPQLLWSSVGHFVSWLIIIAGIVAVIMLVR